MMAELPPELVEVITDENGLQPTQAAQDFLSEVLDLMDEVDTKWDQAGTPPLWAYEEHVAHVLDATGTLNQDVVFDCDTCNPPPTPPPSLITPTPKEQYL